MLSIVGEVLLLQHNT